MEDEVEGWVVILVLIIVGAVLLWTYVLQPAIAWISQNWWIVTIVIGVIVVGGFLFLGWVGGTEEEEEEEMRKQAELERHRREKQDKLEKSIIRKKLLNERESELEGLDLTAEEKEFQINKWVEEGYRKQHSGESEIFAVQTTFDEIANALEGWIPSKRFRDESYAEIGTLEFLKHDFPDIKYQQYHEGFRADLEIENIGIEIKLPKKSRHLTTLRGQMMQYCKCFDYVIALIFDYHHLPEETLESFADDVDEHYGHEVRVIIKR